MDVYQVFKITNRRDASRAPAKLTGSYHVMPLYIDLCDINRRVLSHIAYVDKAIVNENVANMLEKTAGDTKIYFWNGCASQYGKVYFNYTIINDESQRLLLIEPELGRAIGWAVEVEEQDPPIAVVEQLQQQHGLRHKSKKRIVEFDIDFDSE